MTREYTHAVAHRILLPNGKRADELIYAANEPHAYEIAHSIASQGAADIAVIKLSTPTTISDPE